MIKLFVPDLFFLLFNKYLPLHLVGYAKIWSFLEEYDFFTHMYLSTQTKKFPIFIHFRYVTFLMEYQNNYFGARILSLWLFILCIKLFLVTWGQTDPLLASGNTLGDVSQTIHVRCSISRDLVCISMQQISQRCHKTIDITNFTRWVHSLT